MEALVLLADWAEAINGKLYIQGGGWTRVGLGNPPLLNCALAIRFLVGWDEANRKHRIVIRLVDSDGQPVSPPGSGPVEIQSQLEVGRPAGVPEGSDLNAAMALQFHGLPLIKGKRYNFSVEINGNPIKTGAMFDAI